MFDNLIIKWVIFKEKCQKLACFISDNLTIFFVKNWTFLFVGQVKQQDINGTLNSERYTIIIIIKRHFSQLNPDLIDYNN